MRRTNVFLLGILLLVVGSPLLSTSSVALSESVPVIAAAGDIACAPPGTPTTRKCHQQATAALLDDLGDPDDPDRRYDAVLPLGDEQYNCGEPSAFQAVYDPTWGRHNSVVQPIVGDNEYSGSTCSVPGAAGYFTYFGDRASPNEPGCTSYCKGYYSYDLGSWHIIALNSECARTEIGGCSLSAPQGKWLKADLAAHPNMCTLAYFHRPYWANGHVVAKYKPYVTALYNAGVEVLLVGHSHIYQRMAPQTPSSVRDDARGIRQFIVGTGGYSHGSLSASPLPNTEVRNNNTFGVLQLTLNATSYDWTFRPEAGKSFSDSGSTACH